MSFNIFGPATKKDIRVGYIDPDLGYVENISILEANKYAALNPGTMFILKNRDATRYLTLNEVNALTTDALDVEGNACTGEIRGLRPGERAPFPPTGPTGGTGSGETQTGNSYDEGCRGRLFLSGGGGVGAVGSPIFGTDGSLLAIRVVSGGFGYKYPPKAKLVDTCRRGSGAVIRTILGDLPPTTEYFDQEEDFEIYDLTPDGTELSGYGLRYGVQGEVLGEWDPNLFATLAADPIQLEINKYQDFLLSFANPWWHTRKEDPISVTFRDKTTRVIHEVAHFAWGGKEVTAQKSPPSEEEFFEDVKFKVFRQGGKKAGSGLVFNFAAEDGSHKFKFTANSFEDSNTETVTKKVKRNTVYKITSSGSFRGKGTEQGLIGDLGKDAKEIKGNKKGSVIFADFVESSNDNDDLQVEATQGKFTASNERRENGHTINDLTYTFESTKDFKPKPEPKISKVIEDSFMNRYAVSPIPASNTPGSDFAGQVATLEWEEDFPYTGEYVFRGMADNVATLYLDNQELIKTKKFRGDPTDTIKKTIEGGVHRIKVDLLNVPAKEKAKPVIKNPEIVPVQFEVYGQGTNSNMAINFVFTSKGHSFTVPNVKKSKGTYKKTINVKPNVDYKVTSNITGDKTHTSKTVASKREFNIEYDGLNSANNPIFVSPGGKYIRLKDGDGNDHNATFKITSSSPGLSAEFFNDGSKLIVKGDMSGDVTLSLKWDDNPSTAGVAVKSIKILGETWRQIGGGGEETKTISLGKPVKEIEKSARALEQGLSKVFGRGEKGTERGEGEGKIVFADYIGSANDNDDMQIQCGSGSFTSSNKRSQTGTAEQGTKTRNTYDLSFRINAEAGSQIQNSSTQTQTTGSIFTTTDYIRKADRKLWRTNVYGRGGFLNEYGVCPFNTRKSLDDNPYAGKHVIRWENIDFPADGNYNITVDADDFVKIFIGNRAGGGAMGIGNGLGDIEQGGDEVIIENGMKKTTHTKFFKKGKYRIRTVLTQIPGGRFSFDGDGKPKSNRITARFVNRGGKNYLKVDGSGTAEISFKLRVDDNPRTSGVFAEKVKIGLPPNDYVLLSRSRSGNGYKERETITGSDIFEAGREYLIDTIGSSRRTGSRIRNNGKNLQYDDNIDNGFDRNGELTITKIKNQQPSSIKGVNPMALAIKIDVGEIEQPRISTKTWYQNPMGAAFTIDAPLPPIPESPIPVGEGRCPKNPIWTTRFPNAQKKWWPVNHLAWSKFTNRFALSPLPPLNTLNSDGGGGIVYENTWPLEIPYDGFYGIKGTADNKGRILIDGQEVYRLKGFGNSSPEIKKVKLIEGEHTITVEVENFTQENAKIVKKKIFSTQDWRTNKVPQGRVPVDFGVYGQGSMSNKKIDFVFTSEDGKDSFTFKSKEVKGKYNYSRQVKVLPGINYKVQAVATGTFNSGKQEYPIEFEDLNPSNESIRVTNNGKRIELKDGDKDDANVEFEIRSTSPGTSAKFSDDGRKLIVNGDNGDVTIRIKYDDNPNFAGEAVRSITIGGVKWNKERKHNGEETKTLSTTKGSTNLVPEQGTLRRGSFGKSKDKGAKESPNRSDVIFADIIGSKNDNDDIQVRASVGEFTPSNKRRGVQGTSGQGTQTRNTWDLTFKVEGDSNPEVKAQGSVTYSGPVIFRHISKRWSDFMNKNNVSPFLPPLNFDNPNIVGEKTFTWSNVDFPENGSYELEFQADDTATLFINGQQVAVSKSFRGVPIKSFVNLSRGKYELKVVLTNVQLPKDIFASNPTGFALKIIKDIKKVISTAPWTKNPLCASAIMIPPPCPKLIEGTGVVTEIIPEEPGNGYPTPPGGGPPVTLVLKEIIPTSPGINYGSGDRVLINGKPLIPILGPFGTVISVPGSSIGPPGPPVTPGTPGPPLPLYGITEYPNITMPSDTGVGFRGRPVFEPVIVPELVLPEDQLLQVTDLVGLKQTGYVNGRPYYGSTFSQDGILYAGIYETTGDLVQVYATLQESVDGQVTTRASAILRQGSDVTNNDPRLNIPNTPDNLV